MGENTELLNRRPEEIGPIGPAAGMAQLLGATVAEFRDYEPGGIYTPSHITGELTLREGVVPPNDLAIAVNGTVRAVTRTLRRKRGRLRFSAFVAPRFFRAGRNDVAVYVILKKPDGSVALMPTAQPGMPVGRPSATYKLITKDEREIIQGPDAFRVEVEAGQLDGWLDTRKNGKGWMRLGGWSFDPKGKRPAKTLFLFVDGKFVTAATTGKERPDVATAMGNEARKSGFSIYLGDSLAGDGCVPRVRLFALSERGVASELKYNPAFRCDR